MSNLSTRERLELFTYRARASSDRRLVREGMGWTSTISWDHVSQQLRIRPPEVDEEDLRSFLLDFRHFISEREPVFINRIFNDCLRFLKSDELKTEIRKAKDEWEQVFVKSKAFPLIVNGRKITPAYILDLWIDGYYFHSNREKFQELQNMIQASWSLVRMHILQSIPVLTSITSYLGNVVIYALRADLFELPENGD
jgi:hypothetical protein